MAAALSAVEEFQDLETKHSSAELSHVSKMSSLGNEQETIKSLLGEVEQLNAKVEQLKNMHQALFEQKQAEIMHLHRIITNDRQLSNTAIVSLRSQLEKWRGY